MGHGIVNIGGAPKHASRHAFGAADAIAPSSIGAASLTGGKVTATEASSATTFYASSHTLVLADNGKLLYEDGASAIVVTIPLNVFPIGAEIEICWYGAGAVSIAAASGVTLCSLDGNWVSSRNIVGRYGVVVLKCVYPDTWLLAGALA